MPLFWCQQRFAVYLLLLLRRFPLLIILFRLYFITRLFTPAINAIT